MNRAFGIDISRWNYSADGSKKPDFSIINKKCAFVAVRAGVSWGYVDPWFNYSWSNLDVPKMAYHVVYFGELASKQMDNLFRIVTPSDWKYDRLVLDLEVEGSNSKWTITQTTNECLKICKERTGRYPIIYSRAEWVNRTMVVADLPKVDWWLAQYKYALPYPLFTPEAAPPPALPTGVTDWLIHQTAEKYSGKEVGVSSYYADSNRWNGDTIDVLRYFGYGEFEPEVPLTLEERVADLERRVTALEAS